MINPQFLANPLINMCKTLEFWKIYVSLHNEVTNIKPNSCKYHGADIRNTKNIKIMDNLKKLFAFMALDDAIEEMEKEQEESDDSDSSYDDDNENDD